MKCPHCDRVLYSRQRETCGYCGGVLSAEFRLPETEVKKIQAEKRAMAARLKRAKAQKEEDRAQQSKCAGDGYFPPVG